MSVLRCFEKVMYILIFFLDSENVKVMMFEYYIGIFLGLLIEKEELVDVICVVFF